MAQQYDPFATPELTTFYGGAVPTPYDPRQRMFAPRVSDERKAAARVNHDLRALHGRSMCMPIANQLQVGSCAAFTWGYEIRGMLAARHHILNDSEANLNDTLAPRFIYDLGRGPEFMNTYPQDSGMDMRAGAAVMTRYGCCPESDLPYQNSANNGPLAEDFTPHVMEAAAFYAISGYYQCAGSGTTLIDNILLALDASYPVALAILVPELFEQCPGNGRLGVPGTNTPVLGGHAITCVGNFMDGSFPGGGCFIVQNHWSATWGHVNDPDAAGYAYLPFAWATTQTARYGAWLTEAWAAN